MDISIEILGLLFFAAGIAGFIDAIAGGGGLLTVPALLAAGIPPAQALATNKLQGAFGSFSASLYFVRAGMVSLRQLRLAIIFTFSDAAAGAELVQRIDATVLTSLIPLLLIGISLYFLCCPSTTSGEAKVSEMIFSVTVGFCIGFYDGFFGPGTGSLFTLCFIALGGLSIVEATARTKVLNFTSNISALTFFIIAGLPVWKVGLIMAAGQFLGARMGAKVVITKGQKWIRPLVIVMSMAMAIKLLWQQHQDWFVGWL
ncbi:hypothetical protein CSW98_13920 [Vibrio sp. HA2012]|uniref:TSUP family transporter n=1 Tax=Vibrio sp. HA2012 TaxID=1971595 RepID=UPI000C2C2DA5|nr:TSUP family transporter [Vibrio sp. HA2012]PJC85671.1 hypothetical protein CSW98_13920 [Vibrio sp. HA2012]